MSEDRIVTVNHRAYAFPTKPAIVICLDGCEPAYLDVALAEGLMPNLAAVIERGTRCDALAAMPSFTNPNNLSIATGRPPEVHGICGNYFLDPETGEEVMMNDVSYLRAPTVFSAFHEAGARVAVVTAKDKLRALLGAGLTFDGRRAICFSAEKADQTTHAKNGIDDASAWLGRPVPPVYSGDLSEFVFAAGVKLMDEFRPDVMYLSTTDYIQHKFAPEQQEAKNFYAMFDRYLGKLDAGGGRIVITADHGMKPKHDSTGAPDVIYLQDFLDDRFGIGAARVILPITDPYVAHHGALGAFATIYLAEEVERSEVAEAIQTIPGIDLVLERHAACADLELPADRIGDLVVTCAAKKALGTSPHRHDLSQLKEPLRSHGGRDEQVVPFISNCPVAALPKHRRLRNFDALLLAVGSAR